MKAAASRGLSTLLTSPTLRDWRRSAAALHRRATGARPVVHYFHQPDDPYSHLCAPLLPSLRERYGVQVEAHIVPPPEPAAAPDRERLAGWSERDAARLAAHFGLRLDGLDGRADAAALRAAQALRRRKGHYLGATFHFEGEWYWGVDRLHYLEQRLIDAGCARDASGPLIPPPPLQWAAVPAPASEPTLHFYCSLRSPYTYLAAARVRRLAEHYGATLRLRFVLPMVMRGLPVPPAKRLYILRDAKREAERLGLPFGCVVDPVGEPTERGLALLHRAIAMGRGPALLESFLQGVFAEGIDAGPPHGLMRIAKRAGLRPIDVDAALADTSWRATAEANRAEMLALGLWGVPTFRVDDQPALWGQDRLWMLEQDLIAALA